VAGVAEEQHDELGFAWPASVAPYDVHLVALPGKGEQSADVVAAADRLYDELTQAGVDVLYDDRDASPGIKFADADLLGMPTRLTVGARGLSLGVVERRDRATGEEEELAPGDAVASVVVGRPCPSRSGRRCRRCSPSSSASCRRPRGCSTSRSGTGSAASCFATATRSSSAAATSARSTGTSPSSSRTCVTRCPS